MLKLDGDVSVDILNELAKTLRLLGQINRKISHAGGNASNRSRIAEIQPAVCVFSPPSLAFTLSFVLAATLPVRITVAIATTCSFPIFR